MKSHVAYSATFKGTAITSISDISTGQTGQETEATVDGSRVVNASYVENIKGTVSITTWDANFEKTWTLGAAGVLVTNRKERANGGSTSASSLSTTYAEAVLTNVTSGTPVSGNNTVVLTFSAVKADGTSFFA